MSEAVHAVLAMVAFLPRPTPRSHESIPIELHTMFEVGGKRRTGPDYDRDAERYGGRQRAYEGTIGMLAGEQAGKRAGRNA